jgi:hypothetical protein
MLSLIIYYYGEKIKDEMGSGLSKHRGERRTKFHYFENMTGSSHLEKLGIIATIILKCVLK